MTYLQQLANDVNMPYVNITLDVGAAINAFLSSHVQNFIWWVNQTPTLQQVWSGILLQIIYLHFHFTLSFHS